MKTTLALGLLMAALLAGCTKKPAPVPPPTPAPEAAAPAPAAEAQPAAAAAETKTDPQNETPEPAPNVSPMDHSNAAGLTLMIQEFYDKNGRVPKDLNELVTAKMLLRAPTPPPGTRYVIDPKGRRVVIVRK